MSKKLLDKVLSAAGNPLADVFSASKIIQSKATEFAPTDIPALNIALSGKYDGGLSPGVTIFAGPSRHFKTMLGLITVKAFLDKYPEGVVVYLDTEFGAGSAYFENLEIDTERVIHVPITDVEQAKFQVTSIMDKIEKTEKLMFFFDSIGNVASKKEVEDALDQKSVADMSRAKAIKSFFRIITPQINIKGLYFVGINHVYQTQDLFSTTVMSSGTGVMLSADTVLFIGRSQEKDGKNIIGYTFNLKAEKSRYIREKSIIPLIVTFDEGVNSYSGLFEFALLNKDIISPTKGYYSRASVINDKKWRLKEIMNSEDFWKEILTEKFKSDFEAYYAFGSNPSFEIESVQLEGDENDN